MSSSFPPPHDPARDADHPLARAFRSLAADEDALGSDEPAVSAAGRFSWKFTGQVWVPVGFGL